jgi:hypothetical protein
MAGRWWLRFTPPEEGVRIVASGLAAIQRNYDGAPAVTVILR